MVFKTLLQYAGTRLCTARIALLVLLLVLASLASSQPAGAGQWAFDIVLAILLVAQFRLWDDLADAPADRLRHPERVLPQQPTLRPFHTTLLILAAASLSIVARWRPPLAALSLVSLALLLAATYRWVPRDRRPLRASLLVLLKYPVIVLVLGLRRDPSPAWPLLAAMGGVYALLCVYEVLHDRRLWTVMRGSLGDQTLDSRSEPRHSLPFPLSKEPNGNH